MLTARFLDPAIAAEEAAVEANEQVPEPDYDDFAAFRLLTHAELEGYFESKAGQCLDSLETTFKANQTLTARLSSLIFLYLWTERRQLSWPANDGEDGQSNNTGYCKSLAHEALGFGRQFVKSNNGIKSASIHVLSALMGYYPGEVDQLLVDELNQYGRKRGDVAHASWAHNTRTFDSALIEKNRLVQILKLTKAFYEA